MHSVVRNPVACPSAGMGPAHLLQMTVGTWTHTGVHSLTDVNTTIISTHFLLPIALCHTAVLQSPIKCQLL